MDISGLIDSKLDDLRELCRRFQVKRLEVFGSATNGDFDSAKSDLDFLVEFRPKGSMGAAERYFGLLEGMQDLFQRPIDLVETKAVTNPYFLQNIEKSRTKLYAS